MARFSLDTLSPRFQHDCNSCIYIATITQVVDGKIRVYDCYTCASFETIIARFGDDGPDYKSGLAFTMFPDSGNILRLAVEAGVFLGIFPMEKLPY